jgi:dipeptidyl-peptidase-4
MKPFRVVVLIPLAAGVLFGEAAAQVDYRRAERFLGWNIANLVTGDEVAPQWMADGDRFWYRNKIREGSEFVLVNPAAGSRAPVFDHARLAAAMSLANDTSYVPNKLPFQSFDFEGGDRMISFRAAAKRFECDVVAYSCTVGDTLPSQVPFARSPDGRWEAFIHEYNLYVRPTGGGDSIQLTTDGQEYWRYGESSPRPSQIIRPRPTRPVLQWSPDSRRIAVQRMDERNVGMMPLYSSTHQRPKYYLYPYPLARDSIISRFDIHVVDVEARTNVRIDQPPQPYIVFSTTGMMDSTWITVKWGDGDALYFTHGTRGAKRIQLMEADVTTGAARVIVKDSGATHLELNLDIRNKPNWAVANGGDDIIWFSERSGWAHLYRYDHDGNLKNPITAGAWTVGTIIFVDDANDRIFFTARGREPGRNPAIQDFYVVNFDGSGLRSIGGEPADHTVSVTPSGNYFVDTYSRVDMLPVTVVRDRTGRVVQEVERADASQLEELGWRPPEEFTAKARDGLTDIYGLMYKPTDFDSTKVYPVIEHIYPGPFIGSVGFWNFDVASRGANHALAELGFIVLQIDHMGTAFRSKAFQDNYYGNMGDNGIPDHVAAVKQLGARHAYLDLDRVGIYGHSGGGFASTDAILRYPDFYKVAVSSSGNHDNRTYHAAYAEKYEGLYKADTLRGTDNYENQVNALLAKNLKGQLFLIHGDMDDNVHPAMTLQVVNALIDANKSFDLLIVPNRAHGLNEPYVIRRRWDYFVEHLLGATPPTDYEIVRPTN